MERSQATHGNLYGYELGRGSFSGVVAKVTIVCLIHGEFEQSPYDHMRGRGCPKCGLASSSEKKRGIKKSPLSEHHRKKISAVKLGVSREPEKRHRVVSLFQQGVPISYIARQIGCKNGNVLEHLRKEGLLQEIEDLKKKQKDERKNLRWEACLKKMREAHGELYRYNETTFTSVTKDISIICKEHGQFQQTPRAHYRGSGCPSCNNESKRFTADEFVARAREVHGDSFNYPNLEYVTTAHHINAVCKKCNKEFKQLGYIHLGGHGCPHCCLVISKPHQAILDLLSGWGVPLVANDRKVLNGYEIDILIPDLKIGIEMHGVFFHQSSRVGANAHRDKWKRAKDAGYQLIQVFEDEWHNKKEIVTSILRHKMGLSNERFFARKCSVCELPTEVGREFLESNHIQGAGTGKSIYMGLKSSHALSKNGLVAVISFRKPLISGGDRSSEWEIGRYATLKNTSVVGGFSKLFKSFVEQRKPDSVSTYADLRWGSGEVYLKNGFVFNGYTVPNYFYIDPKKDPMKRLHRFSFTKHRLQAMMPNFDPLKTEQENASAFGLWCIHDAGNARYIWSSHPH